MWAASLRAALCWARFAPIRLSAWLAWISLLLRRDGFESRSWIFKDVLSADLQTQFLRPGGIPFRGILPQRLPRNRASTLCALKPLTKRSYGASYGSGDSTQPRLCRSIGSVPKLCPNHPRPCVTIAHCRPARIRRSPSMVSRCASWSRSVRPSLPTSSVWRCWSREETDPAGCQALQPHGRSAWNLPRGVGVPIGRGAGGPRAIYSTAFAKLQSM